MSLFSDSCTTVDVSSSSEALSDTSQCSPPMRFLVVCLMFLGAFTTALSRYNMTTTIIAMSSQASHNSSDKNSTYKARNHTIHLLQNFMMPQKKEEAFCGTYDGIGHAPPGVNEQVPEFDWSETQQDNLKGAFLIGYGLALIPSGRMSEQYSAKKVAAVGGFLHTFLNLVTPWAARQSYSLLIVVRVVIGIAGSTIVPSFFGIISRWVLDDEKSKAIAALKVGSSLGSIVLNYFAGHLILFGGWSSIFYISGVFNLGWLVLWCLLVSNRPSESKLISQLELNHIAQMTCHRTRNPPSATIWLYFQMITSAPVVATICAKLVNSWFDNLQQAKLPQYMIAVLGLDIGQTSLWNTFFNVVHFVTILSSGIFADCAINRECTTKTRTRKSFEAISSYGMVFSMLLLAQSDCNQQFFLAMVIISIAFSGLVTGGSSSIVVDMTTDYAASLIAMISTITMLFGFATPHLVRLILNGHSESPNSWSYVFYVTAIIHAASGFIFITFASSAEQAWNEHTETNDEQKVDKGSDQVAHGNDLKSSAAQEETTPWHSSNTEAAVDQKQ